MTIRKLNHRTFETNIQGFDLIIETTSDRRISRVIGGSHYLVDEYLHNELQTAIYQMW